MGENKQQDASFSDVVVVAAVTQVDQRLMDLQIFPQTTIHTQSNVQLGANEAGQSHSERCTPGFFIFSKRCTELLS